MYFRFWLQLAGERIFVSEDGREAAPAASPALGRTSLWSVLQSVLPPSSTSPHPRVIILLIQILQLRQGLSTLRLLPGSALSIQAGEEEHEVRRHGVRVTCVTMSAFRVTASTTLAQGDQ